jgi:hypothetical protein
MPSIAGFPPEAKIVGRAAHTVIRTIGCGRI